MGLGALMRAKTAALALCVLFGSVALSAPADAARNTTTRQAGKASDAHKVSAVQQRQAAAGQRHAAQQQASRAGKARDRHARRAGGNRDGGTRYASWGGISCVPYARQVTGMEVSGNGGQWWHNAAGRYARGQRPEAGAVLVFRSSGGMRSGHVAVVRRQIGARHVLIDHANWGGPGIRRGSVMQNVSVIDVSENNDWTAVRVQVGHEAVNYGREYPTFGFIYNRGDAGTAMAAAAPARQAVLTQVAEAPAPRATRTRLSTQDLNELQLVRSAAAATRR